MIAKIVYLFMLIILLMASSARAESWQIGTMVGGAVSDIDDPKGDTASDPYFSFLNVIATFPYGRDQQVLFHFFHDRFKLDASTSEIGQKVSTLGTNASWQYRWRLARYFKPWIGGGIGFSNNRFKDRFLIDGDSFVVKEFSNRDERAISLILNAHSPIAEIGKVSLGALLQYEFPLRGTVSRLFFGLTLMI